MMRADRGRTRAGRVRKWAAGPPAPHRFSTTPTKRAAALDLFQAVAAHSGSQKAAPRG